MPAALDVLLHVAQDLTASLPAHDRYQRLVAGVRRVDLCPNEWCMKASGPRSRWSPDQGGDRGENPPS